MNSYAIAAGNRFTLQIAIEEARAESRLEPHKMFWVAAVKCPGCNRHANGLGIWSSDRPKPKYVIATIYQGEIIPHRKQ